MEVKKSPKADLEGKKSTWLLIGYVVVLAFMFVAFEWTQRDVKIDTSQAVADVVFDVPALAGCGFLSALICIFMALGFDSSAPTFKTIDRKSVV